MKRKIQAGTTQLSLPVIVYDNTSTTGAGLSGLTHTTSGLILEYRRQGQSSWTQLGVGTGLVSKTLGTYVSGGIVASGSRAGRYEIDIPNDAIAAGARMVELCLRGAANMHPVDIEIELDAVNYQDATRFGLTALPNVAQGSSGALATGNASGQVTVATLTSGAIQSFWDALTSGLLTAGSIGKWIIDNLNATVSSRASQASVDQRPTLTQIEGSSILAKEATSASILTAIQNLNNLSAKINVFGSPLLEIPDSASTVYAFTVVVKDDEDKLVNLDVNPTITAVNASGTSRSGNLSAVSNPATGRYTFTYTVDSTHPAECLRITASGTVSGEARYIEWIGAVVNYDTLTVLQQISTDLAGKPTLAQIEGSTILAKEATVSNRPTLAQIEGSNVIAKQALLQQALDRIGSFTGSGVNTVLGFLRAIMRKDVGVTTPSDVGGAYTHTTDSLEAIRDAGGAGGGGGGGDPWVTDLATAGYTGTQAGAVIQSIAAKTNTITAGKVSYAGPVTAKGTVDQIIIGDDYLAAHGTAFVFTISAIPGMSAGAVTVHFGGKNGTNTFAVTGFATDIGSGKWTLTCEMPRATSGQLVSGEYVYSVAVHNAAGVELTRVYYDEPLVAVEKFTP
jgi:hypothetical protein